MIKPIKSFKKIPKEDWPDDQHHEMRVEAWLSKQFLVQVFQEPDNVKLLSVNRVKYTDDGWRADITWDELQQIKNKIAGYEAYAVEVYPRQRDLVRAANMRHLWVLEAPLTIGWFNKR